MNHSKVKALAICLSLCCSLHTTACANLQSDAVDEPRELHQTTIVKLLVDEKKFAGKRILVRGYLGDDPTILLPALYFVSEHVSLRDSTVAVTLYDPSLLLYKGESCAHNGSYVQIIGTLEEETGFILIEEVFVFKEADDPIFVEGCTNMNTRQPK